MFPQSFPQPASRIKFGTGYEVFVLCSLLFTLPHCNTASLHHNSSISILPPFQYSPVEIAPSLVKYFHASNFTWQALFPLIPLSPLIPLFPLSPLFHSSTIPSFQPHYPEEPKSLRLVRRFNLYHNIPLVRNSGCWHNNSWEIVL